MANMTRRYVEERYGPIREALLKRLNAGRRPRDIAREWSVHYNTILVWMDEAGIEPRTVYGVREAPAVAEVG